MLLALVMKLEVRIYLSRYLSTYLGRYLGKTSQNKCPSLTPKGANFEREAAPSGVSYETDPENESPAAAPVLSSPSLVQATAETTTTTTTTTLAISRPADSDRVLLPDANIEPENPEPKDTRYAASLTFLGTNMTDQETHPNMDMGLTDSCSDWMDVWWEELRAAPTPLVGNATFLKDSLSPILPQW